MVFRGQGWCLEFMDGVRRTGVVFRGKWWCSEDKGGAKRPSTVNCEII